MAWRRAGGLLVIPLSVGVAASADAQTWTKTVTLGRTSGTSPSLAMNAAGEAEVAFDYNNTFFQVGGVALSQITAGQRWPVATLGFSLYDAFNSGIGLDDSGASLLLFNGGQIDGFNTVIDACAEAPFKAGFASCAYFATNVTMSSRPQIVATRPGPGAAYVPVSLFNVGCALTAMTGVGATITLTDAGDCAGSSRLALAPSGAGAAIFRTKAGLVRAAARAGTGAWSATVTLAGPAPVTAASVTATAAADGSAVLAWTIGAGGRTGAQVWAAHVTATGTIGAPVQLTASACNTGVDAATLPDGTALVAYAAPSHGGCDAALAPWPPGGSPGTPVAATTGAHVATLAAVATAGDHVALAWQDAVKGGTYATSGTLAGFATPTRLGAMGQPLLAAGGGYVNAAWCTANCYAATLPLP